MGDEDFVDFVSARWSSLYRLAWLLTGADPAAEDLVQASLEKAYVRWARISRMSSPEAYVRKVMVNEMISSRRRLALRRESLRDALPDVESGAFESGVADHALLWPLVCALPERQRAAVVLRYYEDLTESQTAEVLGCSVGTVKSQVHDAVASLRRGLAATSSSGSAVTT